MAMSSFGSAFASARKSGKSVFTWNGKSYNTKLKEEVADGRPKARPKAETGPMPRPKALRPKARPKTKTSDDKVVVKSKKTIVKPKAGWLEKKFGKFHD